MLASGATSWGAWDVPAAKLSPPGPPPPGTGLLHLLTFNGATAFRRWKRPVPRCPFAVYLLPLQWGHRLSAMETSSPALPVCCLFAAPSMGPPPFGDGNMVTIDGQRYTPFSASMGPPPFGDGNMTDPKTGVTVEVKLQWGHRLSAMETWDWARWWWVPSPSFNGATAFRRWKPGISPDASGTARELQWGHRLSAMETSPWPDGSPARRAASHCICHSAGLEKPSSIVPWPDCAPCHSLPDSGGGNRPPSSQPNVPANSRQSGLRVSLAAPSPRYLALTNIRRRSQSLPAATEDRHRPPSTPNRARTIALPCPYRPFRCCLVIPSVDLG